MRRRKGEQRGPVYYTTHQVARLLGVSLQTVVNWHKAGLIQAHRTPGGHRRISREELKRFAARQGYPLPPEVLGETPGRRRVLVVDPERDFAEMVAEFLAERGGYEARAADGAFVAGYLIGRFQPHLLFLGQGVAGVELDRIAEWGERDEELAQLRVVVCVTLPEPDLERLEAEGRVHRLLRKPVQMEELLEVARTLLGAPG